MATMPRVPVIGALVVIPLVLASGCGSEATGARTTLATVQNTSYVVEEPVPTTAPPTTQPVPEGGGVAGQISPTEQLYTIVAGDSVSRIADIHGITMDVLVAYNAWPDGINHFLVVGDQVKIPPNSKIPGTGTDDGTSTDGGSTDTAPDATEAPEVTEAPDAAVACTYTIVGGDTPSGVAGKFGISFDELQSANSSMDFSTTFVVGDTIDIPEPGTC